MGATHGNCGEYQCSSTGFTCVRRRGAVGRGGARWGPEGPGGARGVVCIAILLSCTYRTSVTAGLWKRCWFSGSGKAYRPSLDGWYVQGRPILPSTLNRGSHAANKALQSLFIQSASSSLCSMQSDYAVYVPLICLRYGIFLKTRYYHYYWIIINTAKWGTVALSEIQVSRNIRVVDRGTGLERLISAVELPRRCYRISHHFCHSQLGRVRRG